MSRPRDIARKSVRADMGALSNAQARQLLVDFGHLASMMAGDYPQLEHAELEAVGRVAIMEAACTHNGRIPLQAWVTQVIRWRINERASAELCRQETPACDAMPEAPTTGTHDPERRYQLDQILELLPYLPPRQAAIIDGRLRREPFEEIGGTLGISGAWCHQEYLSALRTLRRWLGVRA